MNAVTEQRSRKKSGRLQAKNRSLVKQFGEPRLSPSQVESSPCLDFRLGRNLRMPGSLALEAPALTTFRQPLVGLLQRLINGQGHLF